MVKKIISFLCSFLLLFSLIPCDVFADDVLDVCPNCGERTYSTWRDVSISVSEALGLPFSIKAKSCSKCHYQYYDWNLFGFADYHDYVGDESLIINYLRQWADKILGKDASASKFEAGGGSASPGGVGRRPDGYVDDSGTPTYDSAGEFQLVVYPEVKDTQAIFPDYVKLPTEFEYTSNSPYKACSHWKMDGMNYYGMAVSSNYASGNLNLRYVIDAPVSGLYYIKNEQDMTSTYKSGWFGELETKRYYLAKGAFSYYLAKGTSKVAVGKYVDIKLTSISDELPTNRVTFYPIVVNVIPDTPVNKQTNITINNNTFNGNIYVDNTNKLTYIYPQYTVNNETKISNNPIIYNQETKQYYTYDQTTNNYYYITYGDPAPTPTPSPSPDPGGTTPDPDKPSPTPTPGGSGGGDAPSGGGSNWWDKLLDDIFSGFLEGVKGILKLLFDLFGSILGWIIWLCSKVFDLFPFLPPGVGALLVGGVVVCFILAFIKFIRG